MASNMQIKQNTGLSANRFLLGTAVLILSAAATLTLPGTGGSEPDPSGCPVCREMADAIGPDEFAEDPHDFACAGCHHPHTDEETPEIRRTCESAGCHLRAWTKTVFHRLDPDVFVDCLNCHQSHVWSLDGQDCQSCHKGGGTDPANSPLVASLGFSHRNHAGVECRACHESTRKHAVNLVRDQTDCISCHHASSAAGQDCRSCHSGEATRKTRMVSTTFSLSVWDADRVENRKLPFSHAKHEGLECTQCHRNAEKPGEGTCQNCHADHHEDGRTQCISCHTDSPLEAHPVEVHETECGDCHEAGPATMFETRNLCLACHQDRVEHNKEDTCVDCHEPGP